MLKLSHQRTPSSPLALSAESVMTFLTIVTTAMLLLAAVRLCSSLILHHHHDAKSSFAIANRHLNLSQRCQLKLMMAGSSSSTTTTMSTQQDPSATTSRRIFCYGDSLTTGTSPPLDQLFPYGPHLERELNRLYNNNNHQNDAVMVRWRGLPGWTANTMVQYVTDTSYGLQSVLDSIRNPSLSLVIILAGTNDIGLLTSSSSMASSSSSSNAKEAVEPILKLHQTCLDCQDEHETNLNIHTLAIGIPSSAWQCMNSNAAKLFNDMNNALQTFASNEDRVTYIDFPFTYKQGSRNWSGDGLHFSPMGYETLGKALAPCVKEILDTL